MKRLSVLLCACLLLTGCQWLPQAREMGDMALLRTMGVDKAEEGLAVTVSTGPRARGLEGDQEPALTLSARRQSLSAAVLALQGLSDSYVFFGYVDQLLLGEEQARESVTPVLDYFARDVELGMGARVWVVRGASAEDAVRSGGDQGVESRLSTLQTDGEMGVTAISRTVGEVYADLLEQGSAYVPALMPAGREGATLIGGGYAVLKGDAIAGYLDGEAARGLELLAGEPSADVLELELPTGRVTVRISGANTACRLRSDGLSLTCRVTARLAEYDRPLTEEELEALGILLADREKARIGEALDQLREWGTDCAGLGPRAALTSPGTWSAVRADWPQVFARTEPDITVRADVYD